jgi:hypothetical protein
VQQFGHARTAAAPGQALAHQGQQLAVLVGLLLRAPTRLRRPQPRLGSHRGSRCYRLHHAPPQRARRRRVFQPEGRPRPQQLQRRLVVRLPRHCCRRGPVKRCARRRGRRGLQQHQRLALEQ